MKKISFLIVTVIISSLFFPLFAQKTKAKKSIPTKATEIKKGTLFFTETNINIGSVEDDDFGTKAVYHFKNIGEGSITILNVKPDCNCLVSEWPKKPIAFNEEGEIVVKYFPKDQDGNQQKTFTVFTDGDPATTNLKLTAFVNNKNAQTLAFFPAKQGNVRFTQYDLNYGDVYTNSADTIEVGVYNNTNKMMQISGFKTPDYITVLHNISSITPKSSVSIKFILSGIAAKDYGEKLEEVLMGTNDSLFPVKKFVVRANLKEDFSMLTPDQLKKAPVFEAITPLVMLDTVYTYSTSNATFEITNKGKSPLYIRKIFGTCGCTEIAYDVNEPIKKGKKVKIKVIYNSKSDLGLVSKKITVITNSPTNPVNQLELKANVIYRKSQSKK